MEDSTANVGRGGRAVIVLCGGKSRRMGKDKASLPFADSTMLAKVVSVAQQLASHVLVVKAAGQVLPEIPAGVRVVDDEFPDEGPLRATVTGLASLPREVKRVMLLGCDMPLIEADILAPLFDQLKDFDAVIPEVEGRAQPLAAVYQGWVVPILQESLESGNRKMLASIQNLHVRWIELPASAAFENVNTPADYAKAKAAWLAGISANDFDADPLSKGDRPMPHVEAWQQVQRQFTIADDLILEFLGDLEPDLWFRMPGEGVTHIAWQVGHLVVSNYGLGLAYARGPKPEDATLVPEGFRELFGRGSQPSADSSIYPSGEALDQAYRAVSQAIRLESPAYDLAGLDTPLEQPRPLFKTRFEALSFLPQHMMLHLGQMSLLRRLAGKPPRR